MKRLLILLVSAVMFMSFASRTMADLLPIDPEGAPQYYARIAQYDLATCPLGQRTVTCWFYDCYKYRDNPNFKELISDGKYQHKYCAVNMLAEIFSFMVSLIGTMVVEVCVWWLAGIRSRRNWITILLANLVSVAMAYQVVVRWRAVGWWLLAETGVVIFETLIFLIFMDESVSRKRIIAFTIIANILSAFAAFGISKFLVV